MLIKACVFCDSQAPEPKSLPLQAEEQKHEAGKAIYESTDQSHSANEERAAQDLTLMASEEEACLTKDVKEGECLTQGVNEEACLTMGINEEACQTKGINEEACLTKDVNEGVCLTEGVKEETCLTKDVKANLNLKDVNHHNEYSDNEEQDNEQWEEPKQQVSHTAGSEREEPKQEVSHTAVPQREEPNQDVSHTEGYHMESPIDKGFERVEFVIKTSERKGLMTEESDREGLVDETSGSEGLKHGELKREIMAELSVKEELKNDVMETGKPQTMPCTSSDPGEEPFEKGQRSRPEGNAAGGHLTFDLENSRQHETADSALSLASFPLCASDESPCPSGLPPSEGTPEALHRMGLPTAQ